MLESMCACVYMYMCKYIRVCMGCGAGGKYLLFSAELCHGLDPAYQRRLLNMVDLDCHPGWVIPDVCACARLVMMCLSGLESEGCLSLEDPEFSQCLCIVLSGKRTS